MDGSKVGYSDFSSSMLFLAQYKGYDSMYFSKLYKMFRIGYILRLEEKGQDMDKQR